MNSPEKPPLWKQILSKIVPYDSKIRIFIKIFIKLLKQPRQFLYYLKPHKIARIFYYYRHGGIEKVSQILDERFLMGADLELEFQVMPLLEGTKISDFPQLLFKEESHPLVSIIIPVFNNFALTYNCLRSVLTHSGNVPYEIILADDCSTDLTCEIAKIAKNISICKTPENYKFLRNCNHAAQKARGKYILFLNNDTQVQANWLEPLTSLMEKEPLIGLTGAKLIYPDGRLQEAGGILWNDGSAWNYGNGKNPALPEYNYVKNVDYISGAAIMIRKTLWLQIGGFDERFSPAYCEDSDLALEVRKKGYQVVFQPKSLVVHFEGMSNGNDINHGLKAFQTANQSTLFHKWKAILEREHLDNGRDVFLARDHSQQKRHILVIDHMVPRHDKDAGAKNVFMYTKIFAEIGLQVTFLPADFFPYQPYTDELEQLGIEVLYGNYYFKHWKSWLADHLHYFDYIYINRPHIAIRFIDIIKEYSKGKIIYFGHDLHYLREQRAYEINQNPELLPSIQKWKTIEFKLIHEADVVYVVGDYEYKLLKKEFPEKQIRNIPIFAYDFVDESSPSTKAEEKNNLLFVGGFNHPPNVDAVLWFAKEIFPDILACYPDIRWYIVGSNPPEEIQNLNSEHITVTGFVSDEELISYYKACRLAVVPLRYGAGVKGKVIESIYHQCPVITTPVGAEGISTKENVFEIASADKSMSKAIIHLYNDFDRLAEMTQLSAAYINKYYTEQNVLDVILKDIVPEKFTL